MTTLKEQLKEKINWEQVDLVMVCHFYLWLKETNLNKKDFILHPEPKLTSLPLNELLRARNWSIRRKTAGMLQKTRTTSLRMDSMPKTMQADGNLFRLRKDLSFLWICLVHVFITSKSPICHHLKREWKFWHLSKTAEFLRYFGRESILKRFFL
jgi:hypothetical protein